MYLPVVQETTENWAGCLEQSSTHSYVVWHTTNRSCKHYTTTTTCLMEVAHWKVLYEWTITWSCAIMIVILVGHAASHWFWKLIVISIYYINRNPWLGIVLNCIVLYYYKIIYIKIKDFFCIATFWRWDLLNKKLSYHKFERQVATLNKAIA